MFMLNNAHLLLQWKRKSPYLAVASIYNWRRGYQSCNTMTRQCSSNDSKGRRGCCKGWKVGRKTIQVVWSWVQCMTRCKITSTGIWNKWKFNKKIILTEIGWSKIIDIQLLAVKAYKLASRIVNINIYLFVHQFV